MDTNATVRTDWNPDLYLKFSGERTRAAVDLIARIQVRDPHTMIDIGCGPGNSTQALAARFPNARLTGLDSSPAMIAKARSDFPRCEWLLGDAGSLELPTRFDIVFSNATIQWIPDHARLVGRLAALTNPGGALAVQMPLFCDMPMSAVIRRTAAKPRWQQAMSGCDALFTYHPHGFYYDRLSGLTSGIDMWETSYIHVMASIPALVEWISRLSRRGSWRSCARTTRHGRTARCSSRSSVCSSSRISPSGAGGPSPPPPSPPRPLTAAPLTAEAPHRRAPHRRASGSAASPRCAGRGGK